MTCKTSEFTSVVSISVTQMLYRKPGKINAMRFEFTPKGAASIGGRKIMKHG